MQTDPIGYKDNVNLYGYVANDPINAVDPTGKWILRAARSLWNVGKRVYRGKRVDRAAVDEAVSIADDVTTIVSDPISPEAGAAAIDIFAGTELNSRRRGRAQNHSRENPDAEGRPHTQVRQDADGNVTHYETYNDPSPGQGKRVDIEGASHGGIDTPHVTPTQRHTNPNDPSRSRITEGPTRPAREDEIPRRIDD
jgi:hypothetical protein